MSERKIIKRFEIAGDPVKDIDGTELRCIELRKAKGKDLRALDRADGDIAGTFALIASMAGLTEQAIDEMELPDLMPIVAWVQSEYLGKTDGATGVTS